MSTSIQQKRQLVVLFVWMVLLIFAVGVQSYIIRSQIRNKEFTPTTPSLPINEISTSDVPTDEVLTTNIENGTRQITTENNTAPIETSSDTSVTDEQTTTTREGSTETTDEQFNKLILFGVIFICLILVILAAAFVAYRIYQKMMNSKETSHSKKKNKKRGKSVESYKENQGSTKTKPSSGYEVVTR